MGDEVWKRSFALTVCGMILVLSLAANAVASQAPSVRVQLSSKTNNAAVKVVQGEYQMVNGTTGLPLGTVKPGQFCYVGKEGLTLKISGLDPKVTAPQKGPMVLKPTGKGLCVFCFNDVKYRGTLTIHNLEQGLMVVNTLPLQEYLYGVVGEEMGYGAPLEALKAQALISRSFVLQKRGTDLYADVGTTEATQVYKGYAAELKSGFSNVKQAVDATAAEAICYEGKIIDAVFHSNAGGYTECCENVWTEPHPYLRAVPSPEDAYAKRYPQDKNGWPASSYEWTVTMTRDQLNKCISNWNAARPNDAIKIGDLKSLSLSYTDRSGKNKTASGRATALTLVGSSGQKVIYRDSIRSFFGVKSTLINITFNPTVSTAGSGNVQGQVSGGNVKAVDSNNKVTNAGSGIPRIYVIGKNNQTTTVPKDFASITISGRGHGHGLGLSQWGARGMAAEQDAKYPEIIKRYYSGVEIKKLY